MTYRFSDDEQAQSKAVLGGRIPIDKPCVRCGHNLRGQLHDAPCPECGLPAAQQEEPALGHSDETGSPVAVCARCGYDLRATPPGSACPECGLPVSEPTSAYDPLNVMPLPLIHRLQLGGGLCCIAINVCVVVLWFVWKGTLAGSVSPRWMLATSVVWVIGVLLLTPTIDRPEGVVHGFHSRGRLRKLARWLQLGWIAAAGLWLLDQAAQPVAGYGALLRAATVVSVLAGLSGTVLLAIVLEHLADWTRDDTAAKLFSTFQFMLPATIAFMLIVSLFPDSLLRVILNVGLLLCAVATIGCFVAAMWSLSKSITLSVGHAHEYQDRQLRRHRRQLEREQEMDESVQKIASSPRSAPPIDRSRS